MDRRMFIETAIAGIGGFTNLSNNPTKPKLRHEEVEVLPITDEVWKVKILRADIPNGNGRIYPRSLCEKIVQMREFPQLGCIFVGGMMFPVNKVPVERASHIAFRPRMDGEFLTCQIKPLGTLEGAKLKKMLENDQVRFRTTGTANSMSANSEMKIIIGDDYVLHSVEAMFKEDAVPL
jgi:hypothetical protein